MEEILTCLHFPKHWNCESSREFKTVSFLIRLMKYFICCLKRNDEVFSWLPEKDRSFSSPIERSKPLVHLDICLGLRKDLP